MATTYTWDCSTVEVRPEIEGEADVIYNVNWRLTGVSDQTNSEGVAYATTNIGTVNLDISNITTFTPFADVTNAQVTSWVEVTMGAVEVAKIKVQMQEVIDLLITPLSVQMTLVAE